jgi:hypothetical protein
MSSMDDTQRKAEMTDEQIIAIRKECFGGRYGVPHLEAWSDTIKFARAILAAAPQASALPLPEGWKAVPIELTPEMLEAGAPFKTGIYAWDQQDADTAYRAMLSAAPLLVQPEGLRVQVVELSDDQRQSLTSTATHIPGISEDTKQ